MASTAVHPILSWTRNVDREAHCSNAGCGNTVFVKVEHVLLLLDSKTGVMKDRQSTQEPSFLCAECLGRKLAFHFYSGSATEGEL
jgi:hypothetical protein